MVGGDGETGEEEDNGLTDFGLPKTYDGHISNPYPFFVDHAGAIDAEGWKYMSESRNVTWVIIPNRSARAANDV